MQASWSKYTLNFKAPAGTSRGIMLTRDVWYLFLSEHGKTGVGECAPLPNLSLDKLSTIELMLDEICQQPNHFLKTPSLLKAYPAIRFALEMANHDLKNGGVACYFHSPLDSGQAININGLIWMGDKDFMTAQVKEKLEAGWQCIKIKIGGLDFASELEILRAIRQQFSADSLQIRLDANGAFTPENVANRLNQLAEFKPHSIEQPIATGQYSLLADLCKTSPIPIALDEELIPLVTTAERKKMLEQVKPQFLVLKPSLLGGFAESEQWIKLAKEYASDYWITSALESNIGLQAISQWVAKQEPQGYQGLGTGQLFTNNSPSPLQVNSGKLRQQTHPIWQDIHPFYAQWLNPDKTLSLQTSGSTGKPKTINRDKLCMKASAQLTAEAFNLHEGDTALLCLPIDYIAGKMMLVRAMELKLNLVVVQPSSTPLDTIDQAIKFAAMSPMQVAQTTKAKLELINTLIIGGAPVNVELVERLQSLSTQVYETYGMTETVSHVAIRLLNTAHKSSYFHALKGVYFECDQRGCLIAYAQHIGQEPIITNDLVELKDKKTFKWLGRVDHVINSGGIKIIPEQLEEKLAKALKGSRYFITAMPDKALGECVALVVEGEAVVFDMTLLAFLPVYERPREIVFIKEFQQTASGKIMRNKTMGIR